jgi:hypothetical protein
MAHYLEAEDPAGIIHEVVIPAEFESCHARIEGTRKIGDRWMMAYRLGGVRVYVEMPSDYTSTSGWRFGGYRRDVVARSVAD